MDGCLVSMFFCENLYMSKYVKRTLDGKYELYSGLPEFGYELIATLPYAYKLHLDGALHSTTSGLDTGCFYFFSPHHNEVKEKRAWDNCRKLNREKFPNIQIHKPQLSWEDFSPPPLNDFYRDEAIIFDKPSVVIFNRKNREWSGEPINYLDRATLERLFHLLKDKYQIVYIDAAHFGSEYEDHAEFENCEFSNADVVKMGIKTLISLRADYPELSVNEIQCRVYAGCEKFISSNGGLGILASYFGGENIIFSKMCREIDPSINSFYHWYPKLSKSTISVVRSELELINSVREKWIENRPFFNVLIRTSGRPNYFHDCIRSVLDQDYKNFRIIVGSDDADSRRYIQGHPCTIVELKRRGPEPAEKPKGSEYGLYFPYNEYFNDMLSYVNTGFVIYLDDDDCLIDRFSLGKLANEISNRQSDLVFWRVRFPEKIVPSDENWLKKVPVCRDMSTIGYCHDIGVRPVWEPWKRGDYRVANFLFHNCSSVHWFDEQLTTLQREVQDGYGLRDDKKRIDPSLEPPLAVIVTIDSDVDALKRCLDSIVMSTSLMSVSVQVLVGINGCAEVMKEAKRLTRFFSEKVDFYFKKKRVRNSVIQEALVNKITRRDGFVVFLHGSDAFFSGCLTSYYSEMREMVLNDGFQGYMFFKSIHVPNRFNVYPGGDLSSNSDVVSWDSSDNATVISTLISYALKNDLNDNEIDYLIQLLRYETMDERVAESGELNQIVSKGDPSAMIVAFSYLEGNGLDFGKSAKNGSCVGLDEPECTERSPRGYLMRASLSSKPQLSHADFGTKSPISESDMKFRYRDSAGILDEIKRVL